MKIRAVQIVIVPERGKKKVFVANGLTIGVQQFAALKRMVQAILPSLESLNDPVTVKVPFPRNRKRK